MAESYASRQSPRLGIVTGLVAEANIARAISPHVVSGGGVAARTEAWTKHLIREGATGLVSFGIAGGLSPDLKPGTLIIASDVWSLDGAIKIYEVWRVHLTSILPGSMVGRIAGQNWIAASVEAKQGLAASSNALAVDLESHIVGRCAQAAGIPFAVIRAVADPADRALPPAALIGLNQDGSIAYGSVLKSVAAMPRQIPQLMKLQSDTKKAMTALVVAADRLRANGLML
jgi:adenosylhomocysteine nucleosidase